MNIFFTSPFLSECARALDDKRLNKMIVESSQMISTAIRLEHGTTGNLFTRSLKCKNNYPYCLPEEWTGSYYRQGEIDLVTHPNHPCTIWTRENNHQFNYHILLLNCMLQEYKHRFHKFHGCGNKVDTFVSYLQGECHVNEMIHPATYIPNCSGYEPDPDVFTAYRKSMLDKWENDSRTPTWTNREPPEWVKDGIDLKSSIFNGNMMKYYRK